MMSEYFIGFDVGGTKTEIVVLTTKKVAQASAKYLINEQIFFELYRKREPTEREQGYQSFLKKIQKMLTDASVHLGLDSQVSYAIGFGLPGTIHPKTGRMLNGNTSFFVGHDLYQDFQQTFPQAQSVELANDANLFALTEVCLGAGREKLDRHQLAVGIILGTGCGTGLVVSATVPWFLEGQNGGAGEFGHTLLDSTGPQCFCGQIGCAELFVSGPGLVRLYQKVGGVSAKTSKEIFVEASRGGEYARTAISDYKNYLSRFIANIVNALDPSLVILGGGMSLQSEIYVGLPEMVKRNLFLPIDCPQIVQHQLGDSSGAVGAALLPWIKSRVSI